MKKIFLIVMTLILSLSSLFAADNAQNYDTITFYLHSTVGVDAAVRRLSIPRTESSCDREGIAIKVGMDAYKNEDLGAKYGATFGIESSIPFRNAPSKNGKYDLGKTPFLGINGGLVFRSRPWDYIDISLSLKAVVSTYDFSSISLGYSFESHGDIYFTDIVYLKVAVSYGSDLFRLPFGKDSYLERGNLPSRFSFTVGAGYAFGGYSK